MYIILSQRIDFESEYADELFHLYHFPRKYRNQIHGGDIFIYYQGDRYERSHRYYYGTGKIERVWSEDEENYYASLVDVKRFVNTVPIYRDKNSYFESAGYSEVRNSKQPPWQSSIRPISDEAYHLILTCANGLTPVESTTTPESLTSLELQLKQAIREYFLNKKIESILTIGTLAEEITNYHGFTHKEVDVSNLDSKPFHLDKHCLEMRMSYSYKAVLLLGMLDLANETGAVSINNMADYFVQYYKRRHQIGKRPEKNGLFCKKNVSRAQAKENIEINPLKALCENGVLEYANGFIRFNDGMERSDPNWAQKARHACQNRLETYFQGID